MKTTIDFYLITAVNTQQVFQAACQLTEKVYHQQQTVYLYAESQDCVQTLDDLLWSFCIDSFLPHQSWAGKATPVAPIVLGATGLTPLKYDVLINLTSTVPPFYSQFKQVLELIPEEPSARQAARERYRDYKSQGCEINTRKEGEEYHAPLLSS